MRTRHVVKGTAATCTLDNARRRMRLGIVLCDCRMSVTELGYDENKKFINHYYYAVTRIRRGRKHALARCLGQLVPFETLRNDQVAVPIPCRKLEQPHFPLS